MTENLNNELIKIKVISTKGLNPTVKSVRFRIVDNNQAKSFDFIPGQFLLVTIPGYGEAPLTFTTETQDLPEFEVAVRAIGETTKAISRLKVGDTAYFRGPLGNGSPFTKIYGQNLSLIAGGIGLAPLRSIIKTIENNSQITANLRIIYGAKSPEELIYKEEIAKWENFSESSVIVNQADGGWKGQTGLIPKALSKINFSPNERIIICGPPAMIKPVIKILLEKKVKEANIFLMLERRMRCGIGKCQHCTCGDKYVCTDGPTFSWSEIKDNWELGV